MSNYRLALGIALIFFVVVAVAYDLENGKKSPPPLKKKLPPPPPSTPKKPPPPPRSPPRKMSPPPSPFLPPPPPPPVTPFDFFMLAQTWPASFCLDKKCVSQPSKFVIHGLWPQNESGDHPRDCDPESNTEWNRMDLKNDWPCLTSTKREGEIMFWTHEWKTHGTCSKSLLDSYDYFSEALKIYDGNKLKDILQKAGISPGPKPVESIKIINAISEHIGGFKPQIMCTQYQNKCYLLGIGVCLDKSKDFRYKDCRGSTSIRCKQQVYYP